MKVTSAQEALTILRAMAAVSGSIVAEIKWSGIVRGYALGRWEAWSRSEERVMWLSGDGRIAGRALKHLPYKAKAVPMLGTAISLDLVERTKIPPREMPGG